MVSSSSDGMKSIEELLPEFPMGPLTPYRQKASFDWKKLKIMIESEDLIRFKDSVWSYFRKHEIFNKSTETLPLDEQRILAVRRMRKFHEGNFMSLQEIAMNPRLPAAMLEATFLYNVDMGIKEGLVYKMFINVIRGLGTERHHKFMEAAEESKISGCFALTEISHGSNAKGMRTTAKHDKKNKHFILNSGDFEAAKCWVGNLGKCATHAIVYAKLITEDGVEHGLHAFVVPVRCPRTLKPFAGVIVGDLGEKIALNGVDNGFVMFNSYRIPAENLLNKLGDVDDNGNYVSPLKDSSKRFGASLSALSAGRVHICSMASNQLQKALTISLRYSAVRKQFGPDDSSEELPVLEYQQQQFRLLPYLAAYYGLRIFSSWLCEMQTIHSIDSFLDPKNSDPYKGLEIHAVSSAAKPTIAWIAVDGIQVCREACGGHGYLKAAGIGDIRNENDANCTYEGENSVLIQQTSNWLLGLWKKIQKGEKITTPYGTADFLNMHDKFKNHGPFKSSKEIVQPDVILNAYKWLICYILKLTSEKVQKMSKDGKDTFTIRNDTQSYYAATLSVIFAEHCILHQFNKFVSNVEKSNERNALMKLVSLLGAWFLEKHLGTLYMGKHFTDNAGLLLREGILELCLSIKPDAVALTDVIAPPDFLLNSVLGNSDGYVYQNLQSAIFTAPGALSRPSWWQEVVNWKSYIPSKI